MKIDRSKSKVSVLKLYKIDDIQKLKAWGRLYKKVIKVSRKINQSESRILYLITI